MKMAAQEQKVESGSILGSHITKNKFRRLADVRVR